jgi:hypothetical protein
MMAEVSAQFFFVVSQYVELPDLLVGHFPLQLMPRSGTQHEILSGRDRSTKPRQTLRSPLPD